jgi:carbonic anhydrase
MDPGRSDLTEILPLNDTECGLSTSTDADLNANRAPATAGSSLSPIRLFALKNPVWNIREQIERVGSHPWIAREI